MTGLQGVVAAVFVLLIVVLVGVLLAIPWLDRRYARRAECDRCGQVHDTFTMHQISYVSGRRGWLCERCDARRRHPSIQGMVRRG